jgi:hypothetical protein
LREEDSLLLNLTLETLVAASKTLLLNHGYFEFALCFIEFCDKILSLLRKPVDPLLID